jgi:spore maturation protein SpmA
MIAYRMQYGAEDPASIVVPTLLASGITSIFAILYIKWKQNRRRRV